MRRYGLDYGFLGGEGEEWSLVGMCEWRRK
jgi:hypothetical protein